MSFPTIHASWLGAMSYASPAPISVPIPPVSTTCMRPDSRTVRVPPSEESGASGAVPRAVVESRTSPSPGAAGPGGVPRTSPARL